MPVSIMRWAGVVRKGMIGGLQPPDSEVCQGLGDAARFYLARLRGEGRCNAHLPPHVFLCICKPRRLWHPLANE
jgi:hypothetical protein